MQLHVRLLLGLTAALPIFSAQAAEPEPERFAVFNVRVGTQTFGPKYAFSDTETSLVETSRRIHEMGSDIVKFALKPQTEETHKIKSLSDAAANDPSCRTVLDMPFRFYLLWTYPLSVGRREVRFSDGLDEQEANIVYREHFDLTQHLLTTYNGSRKSFFLGHWEGDWTILGGYDPKLDPTDAAFSGFTQLLVTRQRAVDDARRDTPHENVDVRHYTEVNLVNKAVDGGKTLTNNILPNLVVDLVSYSCYDGVKPPFPDRMLKNLDTITSMARTKGPFERNVFIGEYGFPILGGKRTPEKQGEETRELIKAAAGWGAPFVLYWEMYDNESGDERKGFWLINNRNEKQPSYYVHESFLGRAHAFKNLYRFWLRRNPTEEEFSSFCRSFDVFRTSEELLRILDSEEFGRRFTDTQYVDFLLRHLRKDSAAAPPDDAAMTSETSRSTFLRTLLNSEWHRRQCPDDEFSKKLSRSVSGDKSGLSSPTSTASRPRFDIWLESLDSEEFFLSELRIRSVDEMDSPVIAAKHLP